MQHKTTLKVLIPLLLLFSGEVWAKKLKLAPQAGSLVLSISDIQKIKKDKCVFFHVWATWCSICMEEMPDLMKVMKAEKRVRPVIVDVSSLAVQESFSKKWIQGFRPGFPTYTKPEGKDEDYLESIDKGWTGTLPFSALFHKGKLLKKWVGPLELKTLGAEFKDLCGL